MGYVVFIPQTILRDLCACVDVAGCAIRTRRVSKVRLADSDIRAVRGREDVDNVGRLGLRKAAGACATCAS